MPSAAAIRIQIENSLAYKVPSALTPVVKMVRPVVSSGVESLDSLLRGGFPIGAVSEVTGPECSGKTSLAHSHVAQVIADGKVAAWIDVSDTFDSESAAAAGIDLQRLLWVRCGVQPLATSRAKQFSLPEEYFAPAAPKKGLHGGGHGTHPRNEVKGLEHAVSGPLEASALSERHATPQRRVRPTQQMHAHIPRPASVPARKLSAPGPYQRIAQGLKSADLILQSGGFGVIVLDLGSIAPEFVSRIDLATWHRYRVAAERTQSSIILLTQYICAKSSAELLLRLDPVVGLCDETTVFTGIQLKTEVVRHRFQEQESNVLSIRKPPQSVDADTWRIRSAWAAQR
jgi:recombination protein RecA